MPQEPSAFLSDMNKLCMSMNAQRRAKDSKKQRKAILRSMKKLAKRVAEHAQAHIEVLKARRAETNLSQGQANLIIKRLHSVLDQLPAAIKQAHERIIGERQVDNADKILSLYDADVEVIVRGKAGAEVEFGNKLSLVENRQGLIIGYTLHSGNPTDAKLVKPTVKRLIEDKQLPIKTLWADRGMFSQSNEEYLQEQGIKSGLCPRNASVLKERLADPAYRAGMKRRGNTEARIAIFKNVLLSTPGKSLEARRRGTGWAVLSHNLWRLARMAQAKPSEGSAPNEPQLAEERAPQLEAA